MNSSWRKARGYAAFLALVFTALGPWQLTLCGEKATKTQEYTGFVTAIEPTQITIAGRDGKNLTVLTREDFTEKVAVGSEVTATFRLQEGNNVLQFLLYQPENLFAPVDWIRAHIQKVIILANSDIEGADEFFDAMANYLESNVGWFVAPRMLAEEIRKQAATSARTIDLVDPNTGEVDISKYARPKESLYKRLTTQTRVDAVLEANMEQVIAPFSRGEATWDGVQEAAATGSVRTFTHLNLAPVKGQVPATTVTLRLRSSEGRLLWSERRGFCVLAVNSGIGNKFRDRPITEVLQKPENVNRWFAMVFNSFLPPQQPAQAQSNK